LKKEKIAYQLGFRIRNGKVISFTGRERRAHRDKWGYKKFTIDISSKKQISILIHRLAMYQRHGDLIYNFECIRHKDGNIEEIRKNHTSYKETMKIYNIPNKSSLWEILNRKYIQRRISMVEDQAHILIVTGSSPVGATRNKYR
jgi:hypothetical protein